MVPDLVMICENMLMAQGFVTSKSLASKFYTLYSLLKDLLSKQEHYDWGLRAIKSVLVVAGMLLRSDPNGDEDDILMRALRDFNIAKIVKVDEVVFFGLLAIRHCVFVMGPPGAFKSECWKMLGIAYGIK